MHKIIEFGAYISEIILAFLLSFLMCNLFGINDLNAFFVEYKIAWITFLICLIGTCVAFLIKFIDLTSKPFGKWLCGINAYETYSRCFRYPILIYVLTIILFLLSKANSPNLYLYLLIFGILYSGINMYTLIQNIMELHRLHLEFESTSQ